MRGDVSAEEVRIRIEWSFTDPVKLETGETDALNDKRESKEWRGDGLVRYIHTASNVLSNLGAVHYCYVGKSVAKR